jgi:hypothetical protein
MIDLSLSATRTVAVIQYYVHPSDTIFKYKHYGSAICGWKIG